MILDGMVKKGQIEISEGTNAIHDVKRVLFNFFSIEDQVDDLVRDKIRSYSRGIAEGSREWEVMYNKLFEEEMKKKGFAV